MELQRCVLACFRLRKKQVTFQRNLCATQNRNYGSLRRLYEEYRDSGFNLIAFPCNQFGGQAPRSSDGEREFAYKKFGFEFPIMVRLALTCFLFLCPLAATAIDTVSRQAS